MELSITSVAMEIAKIMSPFQNTDNFRYELSLVTNYLVQSTCNYNLEIGAGIIDGY